MEVGKPGKLFFLGIGGIGMSALALYFKKMGWVTGGYDKTPSDITGALEKEGIKVVYEDSITALPDEFSNPADKELLVTFTPAIPVDHPQLVFYKKSGVEILKRSQLLGLISKSAKTFAVAGTHGKTTTSTMLAHFLRTAGNDCQAFLGGISQNYGSNVLFGKSGDWVIEADEYDRSFLTLEPAHIILTSMDPDHLDIYQSGKGVRESYNEFLGKRKTNGFTLVASQINPDLYGGKKDGYFTYGFEPKADFKAENIRVEDGKFVFDIKGPDVLWTNVSLALPGRHNVQNALGAAALAHLTGHSKTGILNGISTFKGVARRFEFHVRKKNRVYIDDYAHHPEEIRAALGGIKELYPGKEITLVFQPHLFTRTRDFLSEFARELGKADKLILLDIYPAREKPIPGVTSGELLKNISCPYKTLVSKSELSAHIQDLRPEILVSMGAGDIDRLVPQLKETMLSLDA